jgi:chromate transport protein ChrA
MVFCIAMIRAGIVGAIFTFLLWSLPGAIGMYGLSLGVQQMPDRLPPVVYALLSGLNASTVGIVALAAVQVSLHEQSLVLRRLMAYSWQRKPSETVSQGFWSLQALAQVCATTLSGSSQS